MCQVIKIKNPEPPFLLSFSYQICFQSLDVLICDSYVQYDSCSYFFFTVFIFFYPSDHRDTPKNQVDLTRHFEPDQSQWCQISENEFVLNANSKISCFYLSFACLQTSWKTYIRSALLWLRAAYILLFRGGDCVLGLAENKFYCAVSCC